VRLTLSTSGLVDAETVAFWYFNFDPALDPTQITFTAVNNADSIPNSITGGADAFMADGSGMYDILFDFPPPPGSAAARFSAGESVVYDLSYTSPIDVSDFDFFSTGGGNGAFLSAAQVMRIGPLDDGSGYVGAVPEPETYAMMLAGLGLMGFVARRRRRQGAAA